MENEAVGAFPLWTTHCACRSGYFIAADFYQASLRETVVAVIRFRAVCRRLDFFPAFARMRRGQRRIGGENMGGRGLPCAKLIFLRRSDKPLPENQQALPQNERNEQNEQNGFSKLNGYAAK